MQARPQPGYQPLRVSWGATLHADASKNIGHSIYTTGIYDLAVSETLVRLLDPGVTALDAGANIGYMSVLLAVAGAGRVWAFEPHPELFPILTRNASAWPTIQPQATALGATSGTAQLALPNDFTTNDGLARIVEAGGAEPTVSVPITTLDAVLGTTAARVLKVDVEGHELAVLHGAAEALRAQRITHIVYEDHVGPTSAVTAHLRDLGYTIFALGWTLTGVRLVPAEHGRAAAEYEAPNYLATLEPADAQRRCAPRGWRVLRRLG
jgi:FkbM family methyltransferase